MSYRHFALCLPILSLLVIYGCDTDSYNPPVDGGSGTPLYTTPDSTFGFGVLEKVVGIWNGPVTSTTPLGGYNEWIVDFRPIAASQVSAKNELDRHNDIHMSFFVTRYKGSYRVAFRNGGMFGGQTRVSYFLADSVSETATQSYYRFSEVVRGAERAFTEVIRRQDSLIVRSATNRYNMQATSSQHMEWRARLQDMNASEAAIATHDFPQKELTIDLTEGLQNRTEAIFYTFSDGDPYTEQQQPYLGQAAVTYSFAGGFTPDPARKVFIVITTQPLISGFNFDTAAMRYRSRYVLLDADDGSFTFNYMHPGSYYAYAIYDADGSGGLSSGDRVSAANTALNLAAEGTASGSLSINFTIP
jgi:hypothetical protein